MAESNDLQRITDKYSGAQLCDMNSEQLEEFLGGIAKRASADTLKALGLDDEFAAMDIRALRNIMRDYKAAKKIAATGIVTLLKRIWDTGSKIAGTLFILYVLVKLGVNSDKIQKIGEVIDFGK